MSFDFTRMFEIIGKIQVKSITDQLFKFGLFTLILGLLSAIFSPFRWTTILIFGIGCLLIILGVVFYIYFAIKNPDYLRSEKFQIQKKSIEILGDKENQINSNVKDIVYIASPYSQKQLTNKSVGE